MEYLYNYPLLWISPIFLRFRMISINNRWIYPKCIKCLEIWSICTNARYYEIGNSISFFEFATTYILVSHCLQTIRSSIFRQLVFVAETLKNLWRFAYVESWVCRSSKSILYNILSKKNNKNYFFYNRIFFICFFCIVFFFNIIIIILFQMANLWEIVTSCNTKTSWCFGIRLIQCHDWNENRSNVYFLYHRFWLRIQNFSNIFLDR